MNLPPSGWHTFGTHAYEGAGPVMEFSTETDEAGMPLWERVRHAEPERPRCLRCDVPIYLDEGVWRREATGSPECPRNPARDGHEPLTALDAESDAAVGDVEGLSDALLASCRWRTEGDYTWVEMESLVAALAAHVTGVAQRARTEGEVKALRDLAADVDAKGYGWSGVADANRFRQRLLDRADRIEAQR